MVGKSEEISIMPSNFQNFRLRHKNFLAHIDKIENKELF